MIVLVDVGNSRIKWAELAGRGLARRGSAVHRDSLEAGLGAFVAALPQATRRIVAANVAGERVTDRLQAIVAERGIELELVAVTHERLGVRCGYDDPARLGVDRWVGVLAAHARTGGAACVVSAGTAVTFDLVDAAGVHRGGLIWPGARLFADALDRCTSEIGPTPTAEAGQVRRGLDLFGRGTDAAVAHGAWLALAAAIDRAVSIARRELGASPRVLVTGGDAGTLRPWLETETEERADLVLEGLALLAESG
jgi:type III pantothenate kinase